MSVKEGVIIKTDTGNTAYALTHASKVLYPSSTSPNGTTTLDEALSGASIRVQTGLSLEDEDFYDPVVDPLVKSYIDSLLAQFISESVTIANTAWTSDVASGYYKTTVAITGMAAGTYPVLSLIPANGTYATSTENLDFKKIVSTCAQQNSLVIYASSAITGSLKLLVKGILDYTGLTISLKDLSSRVSVLENNSIHKRINNITIPSSSWAAGYATIYLGNSYTTDTAIITAAYTSTTQQYNQFVAAGIVYTILSANYINLHCTGVQPTVDIPVRIDLIYN